MKHLRLCTIFVLPLIGLALLILTMSQPSLAAPAGQTALLPGDTLIPMGLAQPDVRDAYRAALSHLYGGERVHWAAAPFGDGTLGLFEPGTFVVPQAELAGDYASVVAAYTPPISRAYALRPGGVAVLRSTVTVNVGENQMVAMWELAEIRQLLDGYLLGALPYVVLDEVDVASGGLDGIDLLIVPGIRPDAVLPVAEALDEAGALDAIQDFVQAGGTLYAQSNGAYVAEAAGLLYPGTVDLDTTIELDAGSAPNQGQLDVRIPGSPLTWSWLTETLYILTDPLLHPDEGTQVVATLSNAGDAPAIARAEVGQGQIILVVGHPTDEARRLGAPVFMDAVLLALSSRAELTGDAIQTWNPHYPPHEFPAYERVPISVTLAAANLWDAPLANVIVTETVNGGFTVSETTISPAYASFYTVTTPTTQTLIVWELGELAPGEKVNLSYWAVSDPDALAAGVGTFSTGEMTYQDPELGPVTVAHRPFVLTAQMAARLVGDRDLEADRHYRIPAGGIYLDLALPLENKEQTLAPTVLVTDWIYLIYPFVHVEDQHVILSTNDGETIWMLNEPFLWNNENYPLPLGATSPTRTYTLDDWGGDWCTFTSTYGIHTDPPPTITVLTLDLGSFVTIPPTYSQYITVTADHELLLPCLPLTFDLGPWPGYWYEEPALRYGVHSREMFSRSVVFHGTPISDALVMPYDAGSVYVVAGADPLPFRQYLEAAVPYAAAAPTPSGVTYQDVWSRTHFMPFRASFYDTWDWDTCATCVEDWRERHAAINLTYGLLADLDRDGTPESPVREIPTRLPESWVTLMGKSYNLGQGIPSGMNLIELPIFHGLGVQIRPREADWFSSFDSPGGHTALVAVTETAAYDHLFFQQDVPPGASEVFYVDGSILTYDFNREGMFKLHDGARLIYRQVQAGPNRYEIYDSHVHSPLGLSSDGRVVGQVGPTSVSVYGDDLYYVYAVDDRYDPRRFDEDSYMNSWGYGDFVATSYVGGRDEKTLLRAIVGSHGRTQARVSLDNNTGVTLTDVLVTIDAPDWLTVTPLYTDPASAPEPIWPELAFLNLEAIPDAWRGVYYFELEIGEIPAGLLGSVITLPVQLSAGGLPAGYDAPPLVLALRSAGGGAPDVTFGTAHELVLSDTLPAMVALQEAALVTEGQRDALMDATDFDALHPLSDTAAAIFATFASTLPFDVDGGVVTFELPEARRALPPTTTLYVAARATITRAHHGPNPAGDGGHICYSDNFGVRWCDQGGPRIVEAAGAVVIVDYFCDSYDGGSAEGGADGFGHCVVPPDESSEITLRVTAYNEGDALARAVTATLALPEGVRPVDDLPPLSFGDVAPGGWANAWVTLQVAPQGGGIEEEASGWRFPVVSYTWGQFFDTASQRTISGQLGDEYAVSVLWKPRWIYLPILVRNLDTRPDLLVTALTLDAGDPANVQVTITNQGLTTARDFWVDVYLDPNAPPQVNQPWPSLSTYGLAWFVDELGAGASLTLQIGDGAYEAEQSRWPDLYPAGEHAVWAYVDVWGHPSPWASVNEHDEGNNGYGPQPLSVTGAAGAGWQPAPTEQIPPRPLRPVD